MRLTVWLAVHGVIREVQVRVAIVVKISEDAAARATENPELRLVVELKPAANVAEQLVGLRVVGMAAKSGDIQVGPAVAVDVSPGHGMTGDFRHVRKQPRFIADVAKRELRLGVSGARRAEQQDQ